MKSPRYGHQKKKTVRTCVWRIIENIITKLRSIITTKKRWSTRIFVRCEFSEMKAVKATHSNNNDGIRIKIKTKPKCGVGKKKRVVHVLTQNRIVSSGGNHLSMYLNNIDTIEKLKRFVWVERGFCSKIENRIYFLAYGNDIEIQWKSNKNCWFSVLYFFMPHNLYYTLYTVYLDVTSVVATPKMPNHAHVTSSHHYHHRH